jgi:hypothetical protein
VVKEREFSAHASQEKRRFARTAKQAKSVNYDAGERKTARVDGSSAESITHSERLLTVGVWAERVPLLAVRRACALGRSFAIDQVSRILALPMDDRRIALSKEGALPWRSDFECAVRRGKAL